jgi:RimJ/RimL family protein N-acetyltransferase
MNFLSVELSTNRLLLRPISFKYKADIFTEFTEKITIYMHPCPAKDISETEAFISDSIKNMKSGNNLIFVILKKTTEEFLGCAGIHGIEQKEPELGIWLKKAAHGNKYGLEAIDAIKQWADANLDYKYLRYPVDRVNIASRKIPEALGGKIVKEYTKKNMSGNTLHIVEYRIYKSRITINRTTFVYEIS